MKTEMLPSLLMKLPSRSQCLTYCEVDRCTTPTIMSRIIDCGYSPVFDKLWAEPVKRAEYATDATDGSATIMQCFDYMLPSSTLKCEEQS